MRSPYPHGSAEQRALSESPLRPLHQHLGVNPLYSPDWEQPLPPQTPGFQPHLVAEQRPGGSWRAAAVQHPLPVGVAERTAGTWDQQPDAMSGSGSLGGGLDWYSMPAVAAGGGLGMGGAGSGGGLVNVSNSSLTYGATADGRGTYQFANHMALELGAADTPVQVGNSGYRKTPSRQLLDMLRSRLAAGGPAHTWGERMLPLLPAFHRVVVHQWVREAFGNPKLYAMRLGSACHHLALADLMAVDEEGAGSLIELARQSHAQWLQEHPWKLREREAREPPLPGPMPPFLVAALRRRYAGARSRQGPGSRSLGAGASTAGGGTGGTGAAEQPLGQGQAAAGTEGGGAGGGGGGGGGGGDGVRTRVEEIESLGGDGDSNEGDGIGIMLPLEQADARRVGFDQLQPGEGHLTFAPPPRHPHGWPMLEELEVLQADFPDWEYRLPARMPNPPGLPAFSEQDADTARALELFRAECLSQTNAASTECPKMSKVIMAAFKGQFLRLKPDEQAMLREPQPESEHEDPMVLCTRLLALVNIAGGESRYPMSLVTENYLSAIEHYGGDIAGKVADYMAQNRLDPQHADIKDLADVAKRAWDLHARRYGQPPRLRQPRQKAAQGSAAAGQQGGGREPRGREGQRGWRQGTNWDRTGTASGYQHGQPGRREQSHGGGYGRGSGYDSRRANVAELVDDSYYSAHAAQQAEVGHATYSAVPPPRQQLRYGGVGGYSGADGDSCITCGRRHGPVCYIEQPGKAPDWWPGPRQLPVYEVYVLNCKKQQLKPVRFSGRMPQGRVMSKEVADYLGRVGDRMPAANPLGGVGVGVQRQGGAAERGSRAAGAGYLAGTAAHAYPGLSDTFRRSTRLHAEEQQADAAYYSLYAESEHAAELAEALVSTRRRAQLTAANGAAPGVSQPAAMSGSGAEQHPTEASTGVAAQGGEASNQQPAALQGRPPLPAPVASRQQPAAVAVGQAAARTTVAPAPAARPKPPLPFTTIQPAEGTPPSQFPQPVSRHKGSPVQQAVARGGLMQQLPVSISLQDLAHNQNVSPDALKRLLGSSSTQLAMVQHSTAQGQVGTSHVMVTFSSMAEAMRLLSPTQAFAALEPGAGWEQIGAEGEGGGRGGQEEQVVACVSAGEQREGAGVTAAVGEGAAAGTVCAAAGHEAARLQELEGPTGIIRRPSTFELLAQTPDTLGITVALLDSDTGQEARVLTGLIRRYIIDSGADVVLMSEECAKRNVLQLVPSSRRICTSSGQVTCTLQRVDHPVQYVLGKGTPFECAVIQDTYVMPGSGSTYDVLLGTPLIIKWGLYVDPLTSSATYRPFWHSQGDAHTQAQVPVLTTVEVPAPSSAAKCSELVDAEPELTQPPAPEAEPEPERVGLLESQPPQLQAHGAQLELVAAAEALAAADPLQHPSMPASDQSSAYEPPTSFVIVAM